MNKRTYRGKTWTRKVDFDISKNYCIRHNVAYYISGVCPKCDLYKKKLTKDNLFTSMIKYYKLGKPHEKKR